MPTHKVTRLLLAAAAIVLLGLIFVFGKMPSNTAFWREFENGGHAPLFGFVALITLGVIRTIGWRKLANVRRQYPLSFLLASAAGIGSEIWQYFHGRDAEVRDVLADMAGAFAFLAIWWTIDRVVKSTYAVSLSRRWTLRSVAVGLIVIAYIPAAIWLTVVLHRNMIFPRLGAFDSKLERKLFATREADLEAVKAPSDWIPAPVGKVGKVTFLPSEYPSLLFNYVYPRWEGYHTLSFDVFSDNDNSVNMALRIHDAGSTGSYPDRYNKLYSIPPGLTHIEIPLDTIHFATSGRMMNLDHTAGLIIFLINPTQPTVLYLNDFRLK